MRRQHVPKGVALLRKCQITGICGKLPGIALGFKPVAWSSASLPSFFQIRLCRNTAKHKDTIVLDDNGLNPPNPKHIKRLSPVEPKTKQLLNPERGVQKTWKTVSSSIHVRRIFHEREIILYPRPRPSNSPMRSSVAPKRPAPRRSIRRKATCPAGLLRT